MAIGETILSAVLQVVLDKLDSRQIIDFFKSLKLDQSHVNKLKHLMLVAEKLLADAEQKQISNSAVKSWLIDLKHLFYRAEEIVDEIATEALHSSMNLIPGPESFRTKIRNSIPAFSSSSSFVNIINSKIKEVVTELEHMVMVSHSSALDLKEVSVSKTSGRVPTSYLLEDTGVFGRDQEKEWLLQLLLSKEAEENLISVIAIVGIGGLGKTTLAKLVYNDDRLGSFDLKAWVYVSDQFDISRVTKSILECITCNSYSGSLDLNFLQHELSGKLRKKRFLLVLDDVWNEKYEEWECLRAPLSVGACGSKVIVTTRNDAVASTMRTDPVIYLKPLSNEDSWSLFSKHAFGVGNLSSNPHTEFLGRKIVLKCHGLPLAIKTLGGLLRSKQDINEWKAILESSIWDLPDTRSNVIPALRLSYYHLPSHLKRCFSYCAIFPKGYRFDKRRLVLLWMAENFLQPTDNERRIEDIGDYYFSQLSSCLFFDQVGDHVVMHDLIHDLAEAVLCREFFARLEDGNTTPKISEKSRYFSYFQDHFDGSTKFESLCAAKYLRTFAPMQTVSLYTECYLTDKISVAIIPQFHCLRVLSLSSYRVLRLPESIKHLKQLRFLDVSRTGIKELPESVSTLYNLQTLLLSGCSHLERLPADTARLVSLRHLDISRTSSLKQMPKQMGKLHCLQTLTAFVVSKHDRLGMRELGELQQIRGELALRRLQNISSPAEASCANLNNREYLYNVELDFDAKDNSDSEKVRAVLENLKPHANLERLTIRNYPGTRFPCWLDTQFSMYGNISHLSLIGCQYCCSLPALGQLVSLKQLKIVGMDHIMTIGSEFYGYDSGLRSPFPVLQNLVFKEMKSWELWSEHEREGRRFPFPCLRTLHLYNCPNLKGHLPVHVASLKELQIEGCKRLVSLHLQPPSVDCSPLLASAQAALGSSLTTLKLHSLPQLVSLPPEVGMLGFLETLDISFSSNLNH